MAVKIGEEKSIIEVIEKMVREGQPEEKIMASLKALGVKEEQAKKLLLLGESDTFTLLKNEIKKIVREDMAKEEEMLKQIIAKIAQEEGKKIEEKMSAEIGELKDSLENRIKNAEKGELKKEKLREIMRLLEKPEATHGLKYDETSADIKKKRIEKKILREVKL